MTRRSRRNGGVDVERNAELPGRAPTCRGRWRAETGWAAPQLLVRVSWRAGSCPAASPRQRRTRSRSLLPDGCRRWDRAPRRSPGQGGAAVASTFGRWCRMLLLGTIIPADQLRERGGSRPPAPVPGRTCGNRRSLDGASSGRKCASRRRPRRPSSARPTAGPTWRSPESVKRSRKRLGRDLNSCSRPGERFSRSARWQADRLDDFDAPGFRQRKTGGASKDARTTDFPQNHASPKTKTRQITNRNQLKLTQPTSDDPLLPGCSTVETGL